MTVLACASCSACTVSSAKVADSAAKVQEDGVVASFSFAGVDGGSVNSDALRGRRAVIAFITTYDIASQAQARFLSGLARKHGATTQFIAVILEGQENRVLAQAYSAALNLPYPVALVEQAELRRTSTFADVHDVPHVVVLDRARHVVWRKAGLADEQELEAVLRSLER